MARIVKQTTPGEPQPGSLNVNPWPRKSQVSRPKKSVRTLRKQSVTDPLGVAGVESIVRDPATGLTIPAGSGSRRTSGAGVKVKAAKLTPKPAKGTKVVKPPSPTNRGGVRNPYKMR